MPLRAMGNRLPNGSRLSCGASAGRRKRPALRYELAGAQTYASSKSRPRQLQALVRPLASRIDELLQRKANVAGDLSEQCGRDVSALVNRNCGDATVSVTELFV